MAPETPFAMELLPQKFRMERLAAGTSRTHHTPRQRWVRAAGVRADRVRVGRGCSWRGAEDTSSFKDRY